MPWYNCGTMLEAPETAKVAVERYGLNSDLYPQGLGTLRFGRVPALRQLFWGL